MSAHAERTLVAHLNDPEAIQHLAVSGFSVDWLPTTDIQKIVRWAIDYYVDSRKEFAPSESAIAEHYADVLVDLSYATVTDGTFSLVPPDDSIQWAVDTLRAGYATSQWRALVMASAAEVVEAPHDKKVATITAAASEIVALAHELNRSAHNVDVREALVDRLDEYERRADFDDSVQGAVFGIPEIDAHTCGIRKGEVAVLAGTAKSGKSFAMAKAAWECWRRGQTVAFFTLENSTDMTLDRLICLSMGIDPSRFQRADLEPEVMAIVREHIEEVVQAPNPLYVMHPNGDERTVPSLVQTARSLDADSLLIDQLSHIRPPDPRKPRNYQVQDIMVDLHQMVSTGMPLSTILAHQISREGQKHADKEGYFHKEHLADSSDVERGADWVFSVYQSRDMKVACRLLWQTLASRRAEDKHWELDWRISDFNIAVRREVELAT